MITTTTRSMHCTVAHLAITLALPTRSLPRLDPITGDDLSHVRIPLALDDRPHQLAPNLGVLRPHLLQKLWPPTQVRRQEAGTDAKGLDPVVTQNPVPRK